MRTKVMTRDNRKAQLLLFAAILLAMLAYGMTLPLFPFLLDSFGGSGMHMGLLVAVYGALQLLFAPVWGRASDAVGRKPLLLVGTAGLAAALLIFGFAQNLAMLYLGQAVLGSLTSALFPVAAAYMSDSSAVDKRAGALGRIGAATGLGVVLGPGIGGILAVDSLSLPFFLAAGWAALVLLLMLVFLPESLKPERRRQVSGRSHGGLGAAVRAVRGPAGLGLFPAFAVYFGKSNFSGIFGLYAMQRFAYGTAEVGSLLMIMGLVYALSQGVLVGPAVERMGEKTVIRLCLAGSAAGFVLLLAAGSYAFLAIATCVFIVSNAGLKPTALAYITRHSAGEHGTVMGYADVYMSIGRVAGPIWAGFLFDVRIGLPFASGALFFALILVIALVWMRDALDVGTRMAG